MKRVLVLASLVVLAGCATDAYYTGYSSYGSYDGYAPYTYGYEPYAYDGWGSPSYLYGAPLFGGGVHYYDYGDRDRDWRRHGDGRHRDRRQEWRDDRRDARAPAERMDPDNVVRPRNAPPAQSSYGYQHRAPNPTTGMTPEESIAAGGR